MANPKVLVKFNKIFINNQFIDAKSGKTFPSYNPTNETIVGHVAEGGKADIDEAVRAAKKAFEHGSEWRKLAPTGRAALLYKLAELTDRDAEIIANIQTLENGKPFKNALQEVRISAAIFRYYAGWVDKIHGETIATDDGTWVMTKKDPIGVVGQITPWNAPIILLACKWGPALATGCTTVLKPAEQTALCTLHLAALTKEAGYPNGVVNVVPGSGAIAGAAISEHPDIAKVAFTGSTGVGKSIMMASGKSNLKRVTLELGGKSPLIVCEDANVDEAAKIAHDALFANSGQVCYSATRTYVHAKIYDQFVKKSKELALNRKVGDPFDPTVQQGPQVDKKMFEKVLDYIKIGKEQGAKLEAGGERLGSTGFFIKPTVFSNVTDNMTIAKEEIFGPVQSILKYENFDDVIKKANDTSYGLSSGIITPDINKALKFAQAVEAGNVWVNHYDISTFSAPFGGFKQSGIGRDFGSESLSNYLETKTVSIKLTPPS